MIDVENAFTRREVITTGVCVGFALATLPISSWAITTPTDNLETSNVSIPVTGGSMPGYLAAPKGKGPFPSVVVIHEIFGVHEYIQDVCRRFAKAGYVAIAPYLYFRQGDVTGIKDFNEIREKVVSKVSWDQMMKDLDSTVRFLESKKSDPKRVAVTGFCWGGTATWMYAAHNPKLKAAVAWYGRLTGEATPNQPKFPHDIAHDLKVPVLGLYGGKDKGIPQTDIDKMKEKLKASKAKTEIIVYPDADHGFHADYRPMYNEAAAKDGWSKLLAWFKKNGA
jgi:carboxymethylenebutenolidase